MLSAKSSARRLGMTSRKTWQQQNHWPKDTPVQEVFSWLFAGHQLTVSGGLAVVLLLRPPKNILIDWLRYSETARSSDNQLNPLHAVLPANLLRDSVWFKSLPENPHPHLTPRTDMLAMIQTVLYDQTPVHHDIRITQLLKKWHKIMLCEPACLSSERRRAGGKSTRVLHVINRFICH